MTTSSLSSRLLSLGIVGACALSVAACGEPSEKKADSTSGVVTTAPGAGATSTIPAPVVPTAAVSTTTTTGAQPTTTVRRPKPVLAEQGDRVFAVFVATGDDLTDPVFDAAEARLAEIGYDASGSGETGCSQGAREALPQLKEFSMFVEFRTRAEADRFAALYGRVVGTAAVKGFCADG